MKLLWKHGLYLVLAGLMATSCDVIPYKDAYTTRSQTPDTTQSEYAPRMVLIEDFTGHTCGNCPVAHAEAKKLSDLYKGKVAIMGIHIGFYAKPKNLADGSYKEDYRTAAGDAIESIFNVEPAGLPKGLINRNRFGGSGVAILNSTDWESKLVQILDEPNPAIKVELASVHNPSNGNLSVESKITFQKGYEGKLKVAMYVTEDSLVNWQKIYGNDPENVPNYLHRHVLRTDLRIAGNNDLLKDGIPFNINEMVKSNWTTQLDSKIKVKNCQVILVLINPDTNEIIQVGETHIPQE